MVNNTTNRPTLSDIVEQSLGEFDGVSLKYNPKEEHFEILVVDFYQRNSAQHLDKLKNLLPNVVKNKENYSYIVPNTNAESVRSVLRAVDQFRDMALEIKDEKQRWLEPLLQTTFHGNQNLDIPSLKEIFQADYADRVESELERRKEPSYQAQAIPDFVDPTMEIVYAKSFKGNAYNGKVLDVGNIFLAQLSLGNMIPGTNFRKPIAYVVLHGKDKFMHDAQDWKAMDDTLRNRMGNDFGEKKHIEYVNVFGKALITPYDPALHSQGAIRAREQAERQEQQPAQNQPATPSVDQAPQAVPPTAPQPATALSVSPTTAKDSTPSHQPQAPAKAKVKVAAKPTAKTVEAKEPAAKAKGKSVKELVAETTAKAAAKVPAKAPTSTSSKAPKTQVKAQEPTMTQ